MQLRQLEEQRRPAVGAADEDDGHRAPRHHHTKSLPSALQQPHVQARGTLMDRLNLLESRIRQLSCELDLDIGAGKSVAPPLAEDPAAAWSDTAPMVMEPCRDPAVTMMSAAPAGRSAADGSWSAVDILQRGARQFHRSKSKAPNKVSSVVAIDLQMREKKTKI